MCNRKIKLIVSSIFLVCLICLWGLMLWNVNRSPSYTTTNATYSDIVSVLPWFTNEQYEQLRSLAGDTAQVFIVENSTRSATVMILRFSYNISNVGSAGSALWVASLDGVELTFRPNKLGKVTSTLALTDCSLTLDPGDNISIIDSSTSASTPASGKFTWETNQNNAYVAKFNVATRYSGGKTSEPTEASFTWAFSISGKHLKADHLEITHVRPFLCNVP